MVLGSLEKFLSRQGRNFKLVLVRRSGSSVFSNLTAQYVNIYIRMLGASFVQLGLIGSVGSFVNAVISYPFGWLIDRYSSKKILISTLAAQVLVPLTYFYARDWTWISVATALSSFAYFCTSGVENVIIANSLRDEDRATGFTSITALSTIPTIVVPIVAGGVLTKMGGLSVPNIKVLFLIQFLGLAVIAFFVGVSLQETQVLQVGRQSLFGGIRSVLSGSPYLKRWLLIDTLSASSFAVMGRYVMVYAMEEMGADPLILGAMASASALVSIVSAVPLGALADRIGRIRTIMILRPLFHGSTLLLLFAPDPRLLILAWLLRGTFQPSLGILAAYRNELVPESERGKWMGIRELFRGIFRIPAPILGGILYSQVSPQAPFLFHMFVDVFIRIPLLLTMPRTLERSTKRN
jgi:MFS family permease